MKIGKVLIILLVSFFVVGCGNKTPKYSNLTKEEITQVMAEKEYIILDVRTKEEYEKGHLVDSINYPYDEINETIELDKDKNIFVYCQSGNRSKMAFNTLKKLGYKVYDLGAFESIDLPKE